MARRFLKLFVGVTYILFFNPALAIKCNEIYSPSTLPNPEFFANKLELVENENKIWTQDHYGAKLNDLEARKNEIKKLQILNASYLSAELAVLNKAIKDLTILHLQKTKEFEAQKDELLDLIGKSETIWKRKLNPERYPALKYKLRNNTTSKDFELKP